MTKQNVYTLVGLGLVMVFIAASNWPEARLHGRVSKAKADLHAIGAALEAYRADHGVYPPPVPLQAFARVQPGAKGTTNPLWTILEKTGGLGLSGISPALTTPVAYLPGLPPDRFVQHAWESEIPYACHIYDTGSTGTAGGAPGWFVWSAGPDGDYDIRQPEAYYRPAEQFIALELERLTYNIRYGQISNGDLWHLNLTKEQFESIAPWRWD